VSAPAPAAAGLLFLLAVQHKPEDPIPPGATAKILPVSGQVSELRGLPSELRGLASGVAGKVSPVEAALKDLGAKVTALEIRIELSADVLFDFDKADLRGAATPALEKVVAVLGAYPAAAATIDGHTDGKGDDRYNQELSERRAASVRSWLLGHGAHNPMTTRGWGKTKPVAPNTKPGGGDDPDGRQKNRRVEITLKKG
jgi:outer membrane protein OmpA-like peptidoglycan-associated protein